MTLKQFYLIALIVVVGFLFFRFRLYRYRFFRVGWVTLLIWAVLTYIGFFLLRPTYELDLMSRTWPRFTWRYYQTMPYLFYLAIAEGLWLIDVNLSGVLFTNLRKARRRVNPDDARRRAAEKALKVLSKRKFVRPFEPEPEHDGQLCLKLGEAADLQTGISSRGMFYLPERGVYTNTICFGSIGSAKTAGFLYPVLDQLLGYAPDEPDKHIGGLVFDAKDDFSRQVQAYCIKHNRPDDFMHLVVDGEYICNPINDPDMSGQVVASLITSLTAQVLGESKEAFWKGQYMVLTDNVANGLKVAFDYVNLLYFQSVVTNPDTGDALVDYIKFLIGYNKEHQGSLYVYRNLLTNTDAPWTREPDTGNRSFLPMQNPTLRKEQSVDLLDDFDEWAGRDLWDQIKFLIFRAIGERLPSNDPGHGWLQEAYAALSVGEQDLTDEGRRMFQAFQRCILNPSAPDKASLFKQAVVFLDVNVDAVSHVNPFKGMVNPFGHDTFVAAPDQLFFYRVDRTPFVDYLIDRLKLHHLVVDHDRVLQSETFINWYQDSWTLGKDAELKGKIFGGLEAIINFFTNPKIMRTFAPSMVTYYDHLLNPTKNHHKLFPSFDTLMSEGKWLCVGIPKATYHRATDIICTLLKQQFQCVALQRTSPAKRRRYPDYNFDRMIALMIDEYHIFATVGDTQDADNNFFSLNRQSKVFAVLATQTIENLKGKFKSPEYTSQLLGCCRNKIFLGVEDIETADYASKMVGEGLVYRVSKSLGENQSDSPYSVFAGGYAAEEAGLNQSLSFNQQVDRILRAKFFLELRSFSGVAVCYDGDQRFIVRLYLKPYWRDLREAFHWQVAEGILSKTKKL
ncbi:MAG: TraM recognition domain-containing protein [Acidobacteriota bacterium]|nr:TraM recognition domain-containing protein [Acidobacteriota bacterium]